jgi:hypothetical protein
MNAATRIRALTFLGLGLVLVFGLIGCGSDRMAELITQLKDDNPAVRKNAADVITQMRPRGDAVLPLIAPLIANFGDVKGQMNDKEESVRKEAALARRYAAEAFSCMHSEATVAPLAEACRSKDPLIRTMAYYALGSVPIEIKVKKSKEILEAQIAGLKEEDGSARYYVGYAWDKSLCIMNEDVVPPIVDALSVEHREFQCFLLRALSHMGPKAKAGIPVYTKLCTHPDREVASLARWTLAHVNPSVAGGEGKGEEKPSNTEATNGKQEGGAAPSAGSEEKKAPAAGKN